VKTSGNGSAWGSLVLGLASVVTLPLAIFLTRYSEDYDLLHVGFLIPVAAALGLAALALARRARRRAALNLLGGGRERVATVGRVLGVVGVCIALAALVSLGVYGLLEYVGSRD
jgi:hypothetical protein